MQRGVKGRHNSAEGVQAKQSIRETALTSVQSPRVLEVFCGPSGEMHRRVWHKADHYTGVDLVWNLGDKRRRIAGDAMMALRGLDLQDFNVFDVDAFGAPWCEVAVIAARRKWATGERGAVVITDGSWRAARTGSRGQWWRQMRRIANAPDIPADDLEGWVAVQKAALAGIPATMGCRTTRAISANPKTGKGASFMFYGAVMFEGE